MLKHIIWVFTLILIVQDVSAQGPPIIGDKPIMVGQGRKIIKTLSAISNYDQGTFNRTPLMLHYLPTSKILIAWHTPLVGGNNTFGLGDMELLVKYQFFRKDATGKTLRMVFKTVQTLPTGLDFKLPDVSAGVYQARYGLVLGYETIKYGIGGEMNYRQVTGGYSDELNFKFGIGLPLLKPKYPVKQINLYFEYLYEYFLDNNESNMKYSQGIQYAINQFTFEIAYQSYLREKVDMGLNYTFYIGSRFIF